MRILKTALLTMLLASVASAMQGINGWCQAGAVTVNTLTYSSTNTLQGSYPSCTVTVYITGGGVGIVNTSGTAVTWVSGTPFVSSGAWNGLTMTINSIGYTIASCSSSTSCTLTSSANTQTAVAYGVANAPAAIYSNNSGTVLANPFTAGVDGRWQFFASDGVYDVRFSGGGIPTPFTVTANSLFDGSWTSQGTPNTIPRSLKGKVADILSVKDFGALGDGATDDTAAINLALAQSIMNKGSTTGVCVFFPEGIYRITSALSVNHTICLTGTQWRLKYTASSTISAILTLVGDPANVYGSHGTFMEGSIVNGLILDGQGNAQNGLWLQGVISSTFHELRVTNVTNAGVMCNWCQQTNFDHLQVSTDFETFTTVPAYGIIIDNVSSANYLYNINVDHVTADGIWLKYALNTLIAGGTSEGNAGYGVRCDGNPNVSQCYNNTMIQLDTEVNGAGDYLFSRGAFFNSVFSSNSFSHPGITFATNAHLNTVTGGSIGGGSIADATTYGNNLESVGSFSLSDPVWTDSGQNKNTRIRNESTGIITDAANNYTNDTSWKYTASALHSFDFLATSATNVDLHLGNKSSSAPNWIGLSSQAGLAGWLMFPNASPGMQFISELTYRGTATPQGSIVAGNWGWGTYNTTPAYKFHWLDASITLGVFQSAPGQAFNDLLQFRDMVSNSSALFSSIDYLGAWHGPVTARHTGGATTTFSNLPTCAPAIEGRMEPITDSTVNTWGTVISGGGSFHVLAYCDSTGVWSVMAK